jgi:hypothetical protein
MTQVLSLSAINSSPEIGNLFPTNWRFSLLDGVRTTGRVCVRLDQIRTNAHDNPVREGGRNASLVADLKNSFTRGVLTGAFLPVIEKLAVAESDEISTKYYVLRDGFNRVEALMELGVTEYWFDVAEFGDDKRSVHGARTDFSLSCNDHAPSEKSSDKDIHRSVSILLKSGDLEQDFLKIKEYIQKITGVSASRAHRIADMAAADNGIDPPIHTWSPVKIKQGFTKKLGVYSHGNYDPENNKFGWTVLEGYESDVISGAIAKFNSEKSDKLTGGVSYFVGHTKLPSGTSDLSERRTQMIRTFNKKIDDLIVLCEHYKKTGKIPFELIGFLPQTIEEDADKKIIPVSAINAPPLTSKKNVLPIETDEHIVRSGLNRALNVGNKRKLTITKVAKKR